MAYIGTQPTVGLVTKLSDIASSFNGILTTFQLSIPPGGAGDNFTPGSVFQIIVSLGGVIQNPATDYTLSGSQITFTTAPAAGLTCFIIALGQSINVGTPGTGTVTGASIALATITGSNIASATVTGSNIASNTLTESNIASSSYATTAQSAGTNTTGSITSGTTALTVASGTGTNNGDQVVGEGITPGTTVSSGGGTTSIVLSANANTTLSSKPVTFYNTTKLLNPATVGGQLCRAWVNFNGTGTVAIRASFNVSSITDNGVGDYTVNFTTALADANYSAVAGGGPYQSTASPIGDGNSVNIVCFSNQTTSVRIGCSRVDSAAALASDSAIVQVAIFR